MRKSILAGAIAIAAGCGGTEGGGTTTPPTGTTTGVVASISPALAASGVSQTTQFTAKDANGAAAAVSWQVNGVAGGNSTVGTISASGAYSAPSVIPAGDSVVVTGVATAGSAQQSAPVFFMPSLSVEDYVHQIPRVADAAVGGKIRWLVRPAANVAAMTYINTTGKRTDISPAGNGVFVLEQDALTTLSNYAAGSLHNAIGFFEYRDATNAIVKSTNVSVNVREASMPTVAITALAADAQRSSYVLNLRVDEPSLATFNLSAVARALQLIGDNFDQMTIVSNVSSTSNRNHTNIRNNVSGIGLAPQTAGVIYGSNAKLQGVSYFPISEYFDAGETGFNHEFAHQWIQYSTIPVLAVGSPHWPPSDMAYGIMGFSVGGTGGEGGNFPYVLTAVAGGLYRVDLKPLSPLYTAWDLYLMGLLPPDSVPVAHIISGAYSQGATVPVNTVTIADYVAAQGARSPAVTAGREFTTAIVVLSSGRLLTASEMAFFSANAMRAESRVTLASSIGLATNGTAYPFYLATGTRATMKTKLD